MQKKRWYIKKYNVLKIPRNLGSFNVKSISSLSKSLDLRAIKLNFL